MFEIERKKVEAVLAPLRTKFPANTPDVEILAAVLQGESGPCNPQTVEAFAKGKKRFSTADVMQHFSVGKYKVAGALAALRRANKIEPGDPTADGYSTWVWVSARKIS